MLVRLPFRFNAGVDEAFYLVVGRQWLEGMPPYAYAFDVKPPLLFALMAGAEAVFGPSLLAAKALAMASVAATACALYLFGQRLMSGFAGVSAALFYIASSLTLGGTFSPAELMMAPFTAFGMVLGFPAACAPGRPAMGRLLAAGLCLGAAACVKQTAVFEAVPLAAFLFSGRPLRRSRAVAAFATGLLIVPAGFALFFLAEGQFCALFADVVAAAAGRVSVPSGGWGQSLGGLFIALMLVLPLIILGAAACFSHGEKGQPALWFLAAWAAGAFAGGLATRTALIIYFLPLLQPLCLMAAAFIQRCADRFPGRKRFSLAAVAVAVVAAYSAVFTAPLIFAGRDNLASAGEAAAAMRSAGLASGDNILVADRDLIIYLAAASKSPGANLPPSSPLVRLSFACRAGGCAQESPRLRCGGKSPPRPAL